MRIALRARHIVVLLTVILAVSLFMPAPERAFAAGLTDIAITLDAGDGDPATATALQIMLLFVIIALVPTILLMMTSFTRIIVVLHFMRSALGTQQMPPNQLLIGLALVLSLFIMAGPLDRIYTDAIVPFTGGEISAEQFGTNLIEPLREYMLVHVQREDMGLFAMIAGLDLSVLTYEEIPLTVLVPAFVLTELRQGFLTGFWLYVPFIVIDMIVASILMAMGMMMLPPAMISLPFKLMVFVLSDGWRWVVEGLVASFQRVI